MKRQWIRRLALTLAGIVSGGVIGLVVGGLGVQIVLEAILGPNLDQAALFLCLTVPAGAVIFGICGGIIGAGRSGAGIGMGVGGLFVFGLGTAFLFGSKPAHLRVILLCVALLVAIVLPEIFYRVVRTRTGYANSRIRDLILLMGIDFGLVALDFLLGFDGLLIVLLGPLVAGVPIILGALVGDTIDKVRKSRTSTSDEPTTGSQLPKP